MLDKFNIIDSTWVWTPLATIFIFFAIQRVLNKSNMVDSIKTKTFFGSTFQTCCSSMCTLSYKFVHENNVNRYMSNPKYLQWKAIKWIFKYLKKNKDYDLLCNVKYFLGYVNADYGQNIYK